MFELFFQEKGQGHKSKAQNQNLTKFCKFSSFAAIDHKGYFRKILTEFSSLAAFLGTTPKFFRLPDAEFNAEFVGTNAKFQKF